MASILLGLDMGLAVGLGIELLTVVFRTQLYVHTGWFPPRPGLSGALLNGPSQKGLRPLLPTTLELTVDFLLLYCRLKNIT